MKKITKHLFLLALFALPFSVSGQHPLLQSGPMTGYSEMLEVMLWVQTKAPADVRIRYYPEEKPQESHWTNKEKTAKASGFTAHLIADTLTPGTAYRYTVYINGEKVDLPYEARFQTLELWKWRKDAPDFSFVAGSGTYINEKRFDRPGEPYGGAYEIYKPMLADQPDFMLWLGDNIYLREPDWNSRTGIHHRYTHTRSLEVMQPFLAGMHHYAIWDDHDAGPNNTNKSFWNMDETLRAFQDFWANPSYGVKDTKGAFTSFNWNDADFFLLDNRYYRDPNYLKKEGKTMLGKEQREWLLNALVSSNARIKFVVLGGQFLNDVGKYETYTNYGFAEERQQIIDFIYRHELENVIFITGDRHHSEYSVLKEKGKPTIHDVTVSPLNSGAHISDENNSLRVEGSLVQVRNYGMFEVTGPKEDRKVVFYFRDSEGNTLYRNEIALE